MARSGREIILEMNNEAPSKIKVKYLDSLLMGLESLVENINEKIKIAGPEARRRNEINSMIEEVKAIRKKIDNDWYKNEEDLMNGDNGIHHHLLEQKLKSIQFKLNIVVLKSGIKTSKKYSDFANELNMVNGISEEQIKNEMIEERKQKAEQLEEVQIDEDTQLTEETQTELMSDQIKDELEEPAELPEQIVDENVDNLASVSDFKQNVVDPQTILTSTVLPDAENYRTIMKAYAETQNDLIELLNHKKINVNQRDHFRSKYQELEQIHAEVTKKFPIYYETLKNDAERLAARDSYKRHTEQAENILINGKKWNKQSLQEINDKQWLELQRKYENLRIDCQHLIYKTSKKMEDRTLLEEKFADWRKISDEMKKLRGEVKQLKKFSKDKYTKNKIQKFMSDADEFFKNDANYLQQMSKDKMHAMIDYDKLTLEARSRDLSEQVTKLEERLWNYILSPYENFPTSLDVKNNLSAFRRAMETDGIKSLTDFELLKNQFNKIMNQFDSFSERLIAKNNEYNKDLLLRKRNLENNLIKALDEIDSYRNIAGLKGKRSNDNHFNELINLYSNKINSLADEFDIILTMNVSDSEDHKILQIIDKSVKEIEEKLDIATKNFEGLKEISPILNEFIAGLANEQNIPKYQEELMQQYQNRQFSDEDIVAPLKDKFKSVILNSLGDAVKQDNKSQVAVLLPLIYDVTKSQIKSEYAFLFSDNREQANELTQLINQAIPLYNTAPAMTRGASLKEQYANLISDAVNKFKNIDKKFNTAMFQIDAKYSQETAEKFSEGKNEHELYLEPIRTQYRIIQDDFETFKQELEEKDPLQSDINADVEELNNILDEYTRLCDEVVSEASKKSVLVHTIDENYNKIKNASHLMDGILNSPIKEVGEYKKRRIPAGKLNKIKEIQNPEKNEVLYTLQNKHKQTINELLSFFERENIPGKVDVNKLIDDLKVLHFFANFEENTRLLNVSSFDDENDQMKKRNIEKFIEDNKNEYSNLFQYFDGRFKNTELLDNLEEKLIGPALRSIISSVNQEREKIREELHKFDSLYTEDDIEFYDQCISLKSQITKAASDFEKAHHLTNQFYSKKVEANYGKGKIESMRDQHQVDKLVVLAQEASNQNRFRVKKEVKGKFGGKIDKKDMSNLIENELQQRLQKQRIKVDPEMINTAELGSVSNERKKIIESETFTRSLAEVEEKKRVKMDNAEKENRSVPADNIRSKQEKIIVSPKNPKLIEPLPELQKSTEGQKPVKMNARQPNIQKIVSILKECGKYYEKKNPDSKFNLKIKNAILAIQKPNCNLNEIISDLEKANIEHKGVLKSFFTDNTLSKAIRETRKELSLTQPIMNPEKTGKKPK